MEQEFEHDKLTKSWQELTSSFKSVLKEAENLARESYGRRLYPFCYRAGELFFNTLGTIEFSFDIPKKFYMNPHGKTYDGKQGKYYREYWLCVLGIFSKEDARFLKYRNLTKAKIPFSGESLKKWDIDWTCIQDEYELAKPFFIQGVKHIEEVCKASIELCKYIVELRKRQGFRVDVKKQTIYYKNETIRFGGIRDWQLFQILYEAKGKTVSTDQINEVNQQEKPNVVIGQLKDHLRKKELIR